MELTYLKHSVALPATVRCVCKLKSTSYHPAATVPHRRGARQQSRHRHNKHVSSAADWGDDNDRPRHRRRGSSTPTVVTKHLLTLRFSTPRSHPQTTTALLPIYLKGQNQREQVRTIRTMTSKMEEMMRMQKEVTTTLVARRFQPEPAQSASRQLLGPAQTLPRSSASAQHQVAAILPARRVPTLPHRTLPLPPTHSRILFVSMHSLHLKLSSLRPLSLPLPVNPRVSAKKQP